MRYNGARAAKVTVEINTLPPAYQNEELVKSGVISNLAQRGPIFNVLLPFVVKTVDDCGIIAFEMIVGKPFHQMTKFFSVSIKNIEFISPNDATICFPILELSDFPDEQIQKEYEKRFPPVEESAPEESAPAE